MISDVRRKDRSGLRRLQIAEELNTARLRRIAIRLDRTPVVARHVRAQLINL